MTYNSQNPLIVQSDYSVLVEVDNPLYEKARDALVCFAELIKSPEHIHTYRISPLSIWNACAARHGAERIIESLTTFSKYEIPESILIGISDYASRYGRLKIIRGTQGLVLQTDDPFLAEEISRK